MGEEEVNVERMNVLFATTMEIATSIGLIFTLVPGIAYLIGIKEFVGINSATQNWDKPASEFWEVTKGIEINGYSWFVNNLTYTDCLSMVGIAFLALVPMLSMIVAIFKADTKYKVILGVLIIGFIIAITRPLLMGAIGH